MAIPSHCWELYNDNYSSPGNNNRRCTGNNNRRCTYLPPKVLLPCPALPQGGVKRTPSSRRRSVDGAVHGGHCRAFFLRDFKALLVRGHGRHSRTRGESITGLPDERQQEGFTPSERCLVHESPLPDECRADSASFAAAKTHKSTTAASMARLQFVDRRRVRFAGRPRPRHPLTVLAFVHE